MKRLARLVRCPGAILKPSTHKVISNPGFKDKFRSLLDPIGEHDSFGRIRYRHCDGKIDSNEGVCTNCLKLKSEVEHLADLHIDATELRRQKDMLIPKNSYQTEKETIK
jgi:hypothetical protein